VTDLSEFVKVGQEVEVMLNRIDFEARKIGLSMRALTVSPFEEFSKTTKAGARVRGKVSRLAEFGAFVELAPGVEGLIHVSELSPMRVRRVRDVVSEGQEVLVEVLSIDVAQRRMALSMKSIAQEALDAEDAAEEAERAADEKAAAELMSKRPVNPNLRGGLGGPVRFEAPPTE
jgi:small subunit ribosomal protein S1